MNNVSIFFLNSQCRTSNYMKKKIAFLFNPISGGHRLIPVQPLIERHVNRDLYDFCITPTQFAGHAVALAREYADKGYDAVFAVGGDGTVNEVGRGLIGTDTAMGIIPCGSGNGLARHLGIPMDPFKAVKWLNKPAVTEMDYGMINGRPFFCTCGVGFDAKISMSFSRAGSRGMITYLEKILKEITTYHNERYSLTIDGSREKAEAFIVTVANAGQWGNNAFIAPQASVRDGLLDISVIPPFAPVDVPLMALQLFNRQLDKNPNVKTYRCSELTISRNESGVAHFDGDPVIMGAEIVISAVPKGLKIVIPDKGREI